MKKWLVLVNASATLRHRERVEADYHKIENGVLTFRTWRAGSYPDTVRVFAPGYWCEFMVAPPEPERKPDVDWTSVSIRQLELSVRAEHCLTNAGINTVAKLVTYSERDLLRIANLGGTTLYDIKAALQRMGLYLAICDNTGPWPGTEENA